MSGEVQRIMEIFRVLKAQEAILDLPVRWVVTMHPEVFKRTRRLRREMKRWPYKLRQVTRAGLWTR